MSFNTIFLGILFIMLGIVLITYYKFLGKNLRSKSMTNMDIRYGPKKAKIMIIISGIISLLIGIFLIIIGYYNIGLGF